MHIRQRELEFLSELIAIDSVNPKVDPTRAGEQAMVDFLAATCDRMGLEVEQHAVEPGRPNLLAHLRVPHARGRLLFVAHTDTVPPGDMPDPFTARVADGRVTGRGAVDDKGPIVATLAALEGLAARRADLGVDVTFAAVIDEEYTSAGAKALASQGPVYAGAVVLEGTNNLPVAAHRGSARLRMQVLGRAAHSSRPDLGINAIAHAAEVIRAIQTGYAASLAGRVHPLAGQPAVSVTRISGGVAGNMIPPECGFTINRRFLPGETQAQVCAELVGIVAELQKTLPDLRIAPLEIEDWDEALDTPPATPIVQAAVSAVRAVQGTGAVTGAPWGSDAPIIAAAGIPCVVMGPGAVAEEGHTIHESIALDEILTAARIFEEMVLHFPRYL